MPDGSASIYVYIYSKVGNLLTNISSNFISAYTDDIYTYTHIIIYNINMAGTNKQIYKYFPHTHLGTY